VFEPFYRAGTPARGQRGSGLGLAIARGFAVANGGSLEVESLPGQGATFVFELPLRDQADPHAQMPGRDREPEHDQELEPVRQLERELELATGPTRTSPAPGAARELLALRGFRRRGT
jgi:hypothetical protein